MTPYYADEAVTLHHGDALDVLRSLPDASVDAVVTDPPYGLEFMGKDWDSFKPSAARLRTRVDERTNPAEGKSVTTTPEAYVAGAPFQRWCEQWAAECLRVLKPGGHLLAFGGTRTVHRLTAGIEDAGFEIRDGIDWLYASGFPKSLDVSKAIDKAAGAQREVVAYRNDNGRKVPKHQDTHSEWVGLVDVPVTAPATDDARRWAGWGTALKPAREPIVMARKPLAGTVAANVLAYGTGALNIDACRVEMSDADRVKIDGMGGFGSAGWQPSAGGPARSTLDAADRSGPLAALGAKAHAGGRWPSNVVLSHAPDCTDVCLPGCPVAELDAQSGVLKSGDLKPYISKSGRSGGLMGVPAERDHDFTRPGDSGGASRFFPVFRYEAKAPTAERPRTADGTAHPTVKPLDLMRWLVRLVTPAGGVVLEPFAGSGTTAEACVLEGLRCIAIERDETYLPLTTARLTKPLQPALDFGASRD